MWYILLLQQLAESPDSSFNPRAVLFIKNLIDSVKINVFNNEELEPQFIFGLLSDIYKSSLQPKFLNTSFSQFAQFCMGLAILHAKNADDHAIFCSDFTDVMNNPKIYKLLNLDLELSLFQYNYWKEYKKGKQTYKSIPSLISIKDINQYISIREQFLNATQTDMLKQFEFRALVDLNYVVRTDVDHLVFVLNILLNQIEDPYVVLTGLYEHIQNLKSIDDKFDCFLDAVKREIDKFERTDSKASENIIKKSIKKAYKHNYKRLNDYDTESEDELQNPDELPCKTKVILELVHPKQILTSGLPDVSLTAALQRLKDYTQPQAKLFSFFLSPQRNHVSEVKGLIQQVDRGHIVTLVPLVEELQQIKITHPKDLLLKIISGLESEMMSTLNNNARI